MVDKNLMGIYLSPKTDEDFRVYCAKTKQHHSEVVEKLIVGFLNNIKGEDKNVNSRSSDRIKIDSEQNPERND